MLVIAAQVVLPFGQALATNIDQAPEYQLICTANGVKQILIDADGEPINAHDAAPCPFCFLSATLVLLQPDDLLLHIKLRRVGSVVFTPLAHLGHASTWRNACQPSRAPPTLI